MTDVKEMLSKDLLRQIEDTARDQNRQPSEVLPDAAGKYLADQRWQNQVAYGERRAKELGITEDDVPRLIEEVRRENRERAR
jgi:hypothetical protein